MNTVLFIFFCCAVLMIKYLILGNYSGELSRVSPNDSDYSWSILALNGDDIVAGKIFEQALISVTNCDHVTLNLNTHQA